LAGRRLWILPLLALAVVLALAAACGNDDDDDANGDAAEVENVARRVMEADPSVQAEAEYAFAHVTDNFIDQITGMTRAECEADPVECMGEPPEEVRVDSVSVDGDNATANVVIIEAFGPEIPLVLHLVREDGVWKVDDFSFGEVEIPEGVDRIEVIGRDYRFEHGDIPHGNVAFSLDNRGEEDHEIVLVRVTEDFDVDSLLEGEPDDGADDELPPGVEEFIGFTYARPGETANLVPDGELAAGRYMMLCFIPTAEDVPHVALGMHSEFTID
jgi:hypothetical protein